MSLNLQPGILDQADLDDMRADFAEIFQTTVTIYRQTVTDDGEGGRTYQAGGAYAPLATTTCHVAWSTHRPPNEFMQDTTGRVQAQVFNICLLPLGTDIKAKDRLLIDGQFYEVQAIITDRSYGMNERAQITGINHKAP